MHNQILEPIDVLSRRLHEQQPVDEEVITSVAVLADRLAALKAQHPIFESVGFSPDVEAVMTAHTAMTVN